MAQIKNIHRLRDLKPEFCKKITTLLDWADTKWPNEVIAIACTYRSPDKQNRILKENGYKITTLKGGLSKHQYGLACDIYFIQDGKIMPFNNKYLELGKKAGELGMIWGGGWKMPFDPGHFESEEKPPTWKK